MAIARAKEETACAQPSYLKESATRVRNAVTLPSSKTTVRSGKVHLALLPNTVSLVGEPKAALTPGEVFLQRRRVGPGQFAEQHPPHSSGVRAAFLGHGELLSHRTASGPERVPGAIDTLSLVSTDEPGKAVKIAT